MADSTLLALLTSISCLTAIVMAVFAWRMNQDWFNQCEKMNQDWSNYYQKINREWGEFYKRLDDWAKTKEEEKINEK